jgi:hypothetical protein
MDRAVFTATTDKGPSKISMQMVKQETDNECGACTVAMLTDRSRDEILVDAPNPRMPDHFWLNYMCRLGFTVGDVRDDEGFDRTKTCDGMVFNGYFQLARGHRYYCSLVTAKGAHAVAIDEAGMVFDPSTSAPQVGTCTLEQYVRANHHPSRNIIVQCFRVMSNETRQQFP